VVDTASLVGVVAASEAMAMLSSSRIPHSLTFIAIGPSSLVPGWGRVGVVDVVVSTSLVRVVSTVMALAMLSTCFVPQALAVLAIAPSSLAGPWKGRGVVENVDAASFMGVVSSCGAMSVSLSREVDTLALAAPCPSGLIVAHVC